MDINYVQSPLMLTRIQDKHYFGASQICYSSALTRNEQFYTDKTGIRKRRQHTRKKIDSTILRSYKHNNNNNNKITKHTHIEYDC